MRESLSRSGRQRVIDILAPTSKMVDALMRPFPSCVDIEIKL